MAYQQHHHIPISTRIPNTSTEHLHIIRSECYNCITTSGQHNMAIFFTFHFLQQGNNNSRQYHQGITDNNQQQHRQQCNFPIPPYSRTTYSPASSLTSTNENTTIVSQQSYITTGHHNGNNKSLPSITVTQYRMTSTEQYKIVQNNNNRTISIGTSE